MKNIISSLIIAISAIIISLILVNGYKSRNQSTNTISITGMAEKDIDSDLIIWSGSFSILDTNLANGYQKLDNHRSIIRDYLLQKGIDKEELLFSSIDFKEEFSYSSNKKDYSIKEKTFDGYLISQQLTIRSHQVENIEKIGRESTELLSHGIKFISGSPQYFYTKLAELKHEMIAAATLDAKERAMKIAENADADLDDLKNARAGVFQITAPNSSEDYYWGGTYNTSSRRKNISITMKLEFTID